MKKINQDDKDFYNLLKIVFIFVIALYMASRADAYVISHNRILYVPAGVSNITVSASAAAETKTLNIKQLPDKLTLDRNILEKIFSCHATDGAMGYQIGYDSACDYIRDAVGLKKSQFRSAPAADELIVGSHPMISFPLDSAGYFKINASEYRFEYMREGSPRWPRSMNQFNDTINDYWRVWPDHHTIYRNSSIDLGLTYENLENDSE